jgi:hypothetical protein
MEHAWEDDRCKCVARAIWSEATRERKMHVARPWIGVACIGYVIKTHEAPVYIYIYRQQASRSSEQATLVLIVF